MNPVDERFVDFLVKRRLGNLDAFWTTALLSGLLKILLPPKLFAKSTRHSNNSGTVADRTISWTEPKLGSVASLGKTCCAFQTSHDLELHMKWKRVSNCVWSNGSRMDGASCEYGPAVKFGATLKLNTASSGTFHKNAEVIEACLYYTRTECSQLMPSLLGMYKSHAVVVHFCSLVAAICDKIRFYLFHSYRRFSVYL